MTTIMDPSLTIRASLLALFLCFCHHVALGAEMTPWTLIDKQDLEGTVCPADQRSFHKTTDSAMKCLALCTKEADSVCAVASYLTATSECFGCGTVEVQGMSYIRNIQTLSTNLVTGPKCVQDNQLSANSVYNCFIDCGPSRARLHTPRTTEGIGSWMAKGISVEPPPYIQVDFLGPRYIKGIVTQGRGHGLTDTKVQYVKSYKVASSLDCTIFTFIKDSDSNDKIFPGNYDSLSLVTNMLDVPVFARCVRIYPQTVHWAVSLRFDIKGI